MSQSHSVRQEQRMQQSITLSVPTTNWSMVDAFAADAERHFQFPLSVKRGRIDGFAEMDHEARMQAIDDANVEFRFHYVRGTNDETGRDCGYFKIPLFRDTNADIDEIKRRISQAEYERALAVLENVGQMARIAHAVPYHILLTTVRRYLRRTHGRTLADTVIVAVDRGGRLPAMILGRALNAPVVGFLKVDQSGGKLDEACLERMAEHGTLRGRHVLLVDSTVDSGRQIGILKGYFEHADWTVRLGCLGWTVVGSNEDNQSLEHHLNVNWGVDPDQTFEDNPQLMGVDYAPGSTTTVVEVSSEASQTIRRALFAVPDGYTYDLNDISEQIAEQRAKLDAAAQEARKFETVERQHARITRSQAWRQGLTQPLAVTTEVPQIVNGSLHGTQNILIVGRGDTVDIWPGAIDCLVGSLGTHHSFFAGTQGGNPGAVLRALLERVGTPEVRLYQPGPPPAGEREQFGGVPIQYAGSGKEVMRRQMVQDAHIVLALGGREGSLREVLMALECGKPTFVVKGWGAIPGVLAKDRRYRKSPHLRVCDDLGTAVQAILDTTKS